MCCGEMNAKKVPFVHIFIKENYLKWCNDSQIEIESQKCSAAGNRNERAQLKNKRHASRKKKPGKWDKEDEKKYPNIAVGVDKSDVQ